MLNKHECYTKNTVKSPLKGLSISEVRGPSKHPNPKDTNLMHRETEDIILVQVDWDCCFFFHLLLMYQTEASCAKQELTLPESLPLFCGKQQIRFQEYNTSV